MDKSYTVLYMSYASEEVFPEPETYIPHHGDLVVRSLIRVVRKGIFYHQQAVVEGPGTRLPLKDGGISLDAIPDVCVTGLAVSVKQNTPLDVIVRLGRSMGGAVVERPLVFPLDEAPPTFDGNDLDLRDGWLAAYGCSEAFVKAGLLTVEESTRYTRAMATFIRALDTEPLPLSTVFGFAGLTTSAETPSA